MEKSTLRRNVGSGVGVAAGPQPARVPDERPSAPVALLRKEKAPVRLPRTILGPEQSAALRERLLLDLDQLQSADEAADWVHKNLAAKNTLIASDADAVEAGFREKLATIEVASAARQEQLHSAPAENPEPSVGKPFITMMKMQSQSRRQLPRITLASGAVALRRKPFAYATRSTVIVKTDRALCAAARRPRPITFGLLSPVLSAER